MQVKSLILVGTLEKYQFLILIILRAFLIVGLVMVDYSSLHNRVSKILRRNVGFMLKLTVLYFIGISSMILGRKTVPDMIFLIRRVKKAAPKRLLF
ncbi:hypothetical protein BUQ74_12760 [Leptospira weilii serovar Heyan]|nr:hypothetical protein BUQ74_12760 [Leptospira weilii serovar Heyan]